MSTGKDGNVLNVTQADFGIPGGLQQGGLGTVFTIATIQNPAATHQTRVSVGW